MLFKREGGDSGGRGGASHTFTRAPMTPKEVSLRYSKGLLLVAVLRKGYKKSGM